METWLVELRAGRSEAAWDRFITRFRRLIFAAIRHYTQDSDDVMDVFARVCEALRENDLRRLRVYFEQSDHRARFSTWLVTVVHHLTIDWFRHRDGRRRLTPLAESWPPIQRRVFELVFLERCSHVEAYELIRTREAATLTFKEFLAELRAVYRNVTADRRHRVLRELGPPPPPEDEREPATPEEAAEQASVLEEILASLPPEDRAAVELYVSHGVPAASVAKILGLPNQKAVYNRVYRALAALRARLEAAGIRRGDL